MSAASDNKEAAWTFLSWLQSTDGGQRIYTESGEILPALMSTAKSDAFLDPDNPRPTAKPLSPRVKTQSLAPSSSFRNGTSWTAPSSAQPFSKSGSAMLTPAEVLPALCEQMDAFLADNGYPK